ncbi:MAG: type II toxin-antitoxin system VapC family toxin [Rhizomicrobium sp.]|jgi:predicted nucleic acid-binding protein
MSAFVLDSSVALAWVLKGERTPRTEALLTEAGDNGALVTSLWPIEVANVLLTYERKAVITTADRMHAIAVYSKLPIETDTQTAARAWSTAFELALAHQLTVYDAGYLELSLRSGLPLATLDQALSKAASSLGVPVLGFPG